MSEKQVNWAVFLLIMWWGISFADEHVVNPVDADRVWAEGKCYDKIPSPVDPHSHEWVPCDNHDDFGLNPVSCGEVGGLWIPHRQGCMLNRHLWVIENGVVKIEYHSGVEM